jgi:asparagine synthase (glutamine-hydrolysing)
MRNQLLRDSDWASMAHSLEIRVPFADIELISDCAQVFATAPGISKDSVAESVTTSLPEGLLSRVKTGFSTPLGDWYRADSGTNAPGLRGWARFVLDRQHKRLLA